jgi:hypothetical protein
MRNQLVNIGARVGYDEDKDETVHIYRYKHPERLVYGWPVIIQPFIRTLCPLSNQTKI